MSNDAIKTRIRTEYLKKFDEKLIQKITGLSLSTIRLWQGGYTAPGLKTLAVIAFYTGVNVDYLFSFTETPGAIDRYEITYDRLKQVRIEKGLSQMQLGKLCGRNNNTIAGFEMGRSKPVITTLLRMREVFEDVSLDYLLGLTDYRSWESQIKEISIFSKYEEGSAVFVKAPELEGNALIAKDGKSLILADGSKVAFDDTRLKKAEALSPTLTEKKEWAYWFKNGGNNV